jgi:hypothetical protein
MEFSLYLQYVTSPINQWLEWTKNNDSVGYVHRKHKYAILSENTDVWIN